MWLQRVPGARFLDLFCGSGAGGLEALSRGARCAVLVDSDPRALRVTARNRERLGAEDCRTLRLDLPAGLGSAALRGQAFDLIFADPPYQFDDWKALLTGLEPLLAEEGEIAIEHAARAEPPERVAGLRRARSRRYGGSVLTFYRPQGGGADSRNEASSR